MYDGSEIGRIGIQSQNDNQEMIRPVNFDQTSELGRILPFKKITFSGEIKNFKYIFLASADIKISIDLMGDTMELQWPKKENRIIIDGREIVFSMDETSSEKLKHNQLSHFHTAKHQISNKDC